LCLYLSAAQENFLQTVASDWRYERALQGIRLLAQHHVGQLVHAIIAWRQAVNDDIKKNYSTNNVVNMQGICKRVSISHAAAVEACKLRCCCQQDSINTTTASSAAALGGANSSNSSRSSRTAVAPAAAPMRFVQSNGRRLQLTDELVPTTHCMYWTPALCAHSSCKQASSDPAFVIAAAARSSKARLYTPLALEAAAHA
jgi:hypothetical protein